MSRPRTIVMVSSIAYSIVNFRAPLIRAMVGSGARVYALAPDFDSETRRGVEALGAIPVDIALDRTGMRPLRDVRDTIRMAHVLRRLSPDILISYFIKPVIYGTIAGVLAGIPRRAALVAGLGYVFTPGTHALSWKRRLLQRSVRTLYKAALSRCQVVFFQNEDDRIDFVDRGLVDPVRTVQTGGTGVELDRWVPAPLPDSPVFLLMARLLKEKGIREFAQAASLVKAIHPEARFILLGGFDPNPGGLRLPEIAQWVESGAIEWHDHTTDVRPWIASCSIYVLPSYREGKPRSTQEAMAMGRAVITTDVPGCRDTVKEGVNGWLVPPRDPSALAAAMCRFIENPALVAMMGAASRRMAERMFDANVINRTMLQHLMPDLYRDGPGYAPVEQAATTH